MSRLDTIAKIPGDEALRLAAIERYKLSGIGREAAFDRMARLTARLFDVPISLVSIVGSEMQCFRGACGLDVSGTPRDIAFCAFAILDPDVTVVPDTMEDPRFAANPLVTGRPMCDFMRERRFEWTAGRLEPCVLATSSRGSFRQTIADDWPTWRVPLSISSNFASSGSRQKIIGTSSTTNANC